ncbi:MAG: DUF1800 domain-containing protein [Planctomycetes bacterium]|nr:DUF1800 domain-containing protein [Planctomycetota bacterium]
MSETLSRRALARRLLVRPAPVALPTPQPDAAHHLASRATFGADAATVGEIRQLGIAGWLRRQLAPDSIDDSAAETLVAAEIAPYLAVAADVRLLLRALWSKRQLQWRMVHFLNNHFATYRGTTAGISETKEDDAFAATCFGAFASVLRTSATSPAMIDFLDLRSNIAASPNENYARELLELHTLGVGSGYSEADIVEVARVFTGWTRTNVRTAQGQPITDSYFRFARGRHDSGAKTVSLGWSTPGISGANGWFEGLAFLDFLAAHPSTADRFTQKLCRYFVADAPPRGLLARVRQVFVSSGGHLARTLETMFLDPEFYDPQHVRTKVHDGFEFAVNILRRFELSAARGRAVNNEVGLLGSQPHQNPVPTGYPEVAAAWQSAGHLLPRWNFVENLLQNRIAQTRIDWQAMFPVRPRTAAAWVHPLLDRLLDDAVPASTTTALIAFFANRLTGLPANPSWAQLLPHLRALATLILQLPEAQLH